MEEYPKKSAWIICLLNECEAKGDSRGEKIRSLVEQILKEAKGRKMEIELILVNNASTDNTLAVLYEIKKVHPDKITVLDEPIQGKARAERRGFQFVLENRKDSEAIVTMDADGEHDVRDMMRMCQEFQAEKPYFVIGSRFAKAGKRNKKDEILRNLLIDLSKVDEKDVPDDPRCGGRVYSPDFIRQVISKTVSQNYGLQYELIAFALILLKNNNQSGKILSSSLDFYKPQRSKVFKKKPQAKNVNPELNDLCRAISNVFGIKNGGEEEGKEIINNFGKKLGRDDLFSELSELFFKGKMVTDHGEKKAEEFMETPPQVDDKQN